MMIQKKLKLVFSKFELFSGPSLIFRNFYILKYLNTQKYELNKNIKKFIYFKSDDTHSTTHTLKFAFEIILESIETFLLFLPLVFTFGLLPQINTFTLSVLEQMEIYLFGGTAQHSLTSALLNVARSLFTIMCLTCVLVVSVYSSTVQMTPQINEIQTSHLANWAHTLAKQNHYSQSVLFSVYCACVIIVAFMLSRQTSDTATLCKAFFKHLITFRKKKTMNRDGNKKNGN